MSTSTSRTATMRRSGDMSSAAARIRARGLDGLATGQPAPREMILLLLVAEPGGLGDHLPGRQRRIRPPG